MISLVSILLPSIALQFAAAAVAVSQIRVGRFTFAWGTIAFAMALIAIRHVVTLPGASGADPVTIGFDPVGGVVTRLISTALFAGRQPKRMADSGQSGEAKRDKVMKC